MSINHLNVVTILRSIQKIYFLYQMKVRGHDKGHQRSKSQIGIGSWISSEFDYRHIVELKSKFWCTIGHHLVLFQFWPNLLHKIVILATLHLIFSQKMDVWLETKGCSLLHKLCQAFWANKPNFLVWFKMTKGWPSVQPSFWFDQGYVSCPIEKGTHPGWDLALKYNVVAQVHDGV